MSTTQTNWHQRLTKAVFADPKKSGMLASLALVLGIICVRSLTGNTEPSKAAGAVTNNLSNKGRSKVAAVIGTGAVNPAASQAFIRWAEAPTKPLSRNLFTVRMDYFPADHSRTPVADASDSGFWQQLEKSLAVQADQRDKRENLIANFKSQAAKLRLESTMMGPQPMALVNGEMVGEGSVVASFRVLKIESRRIIVEREGIRLEIQMK